MAVGSRGRGATTQAAGAGWAAALSLHGAQYRTGYVACSFPDGPKKITRSGGSSPGGAQRVEERARIGRRAGLGEGAAAQLAERVRVRARQRVLLLQQRALPQADRGFKTLIET